MPERGNCTVTVLPYIFILDPTKGQGDFWSSSYCYAFIYEEVRVLEMGKVQPNLARCMIPSGSSMSCHYI